MIRLPNACSLDDLQTAHGCDTHYVVASRVIGELIDAVGAEDLTTAMPSRLTNVDFRHRRACFDHPEVAATLICELLKRKEARSKSSP